MQLQHLPPAAHGGVVEAYAAALQPVFLVAGCIGVVAFLLAWLIPEARLKGTTPAADTGEAYAIPSERSSAQQLERALTVLASREDRVRAYGRLATAVRLDLAPARSGCRSGWAAVCR
ncbi:MAG: hypothetical protein ACREPF_02355 [Rhodanobacteraceae bacterium]